MKTIEGLILGFLFILASGCSTAAISTPELTQVTVQLGTTHQALYAGFYVADQQGIFAREGLSVRFLEGSTNVDMVPPVVDGTAQFGMMGASSLITAVADGQPVQAVATILRRDPVVFFSLADSGIVRLQDFVGKRVYVSLRLQPRLHTMLGHVGIDPSEIIEIRDATLADLYSGEVDVSSGLVTSSVLSARQDGYDVNVIYPDDYGVHFYSSGIFASEELISTNPDLVTRFVRASLEGWAFAVENPQEIGDLVALYNPNADTAFESASMIASLPYINTGKDHIGWMEPETWEAMITAMYEQGELSVVPAVEDLYTMQFVEQVYEER